MRILKVFKIIILVVLALVITAFTSCLLVEYSWKVREENYYSDKNNFVQVNATVTDIYEHKSGNISIYISQNVKDNNSKEYIYPDTHVSLLEGYMEILKTNGFFEDVQIGDEITFIAAPEIFGDGYDIPIVSISKGDTEYLDFDTGYETLMQRYE